MKKIRVEYILLAVVLLLVGLGTAWVYWQQTHIQAVREQTKAAKQKELNQVPLPQLEKMPAKSQSEAVIHTTKGDITVVLFNQQAPLAVKNFIGLAKQGYYDGTIFHRVMKNFMIQGGDPKGTGQGGHSIWYQKDSHLDSGQGFKNEISTSLYHLRGSLAMANAGKDTNGSQFFINQNPTNQQDQLPKAAYPKRIYEAYRQGGNPKLDGSYTVFGQVLKGMSVVDQIAQEPVEDNGNGEESKPKDPVTVTTVEVVKEAQ